MTNEKFVADWIIFAKSKITALLVVVLPRGCRRHFDGHNKKCEDLQANDLVNFPRIEAI